MAGLGDGWPMTCAVIGIDVGGTTTAVGLVTPDGDVLSDEVVPTHRAGPGTATETIIALIEGQVEIAGARGITVGGLGVGVPANVDAATGRVRGEAHHVPELAGVALGEVLTERFGVPAFVDNDVNALALGAVTFGAGRGVRSFVMLAAGTGMGAAIIIDGRLVRGVRGFGGELGHAPVKFDGRPCWCGGRGCLAVYASGRGIAAAARALAGEQRADALLAAAGGDAAAITAGLVFRLAAEGDAAAAALVDEACDAIGAMIGVIVNGLNPEMLMITGGVATSLLPIESRVRKAAEVYAFREALEGTRIVVVPGDKRSTMLGAAALVLTEQASRGSVVPMNPGLDCGGPRPPRTRGEA
jgi:glucokinase